jgi:hypothetical protein
MVARMLVGCWSDAGFDGGPDAGSDAGFPLRVGAAGRLVNIVVEQSYERVARLARLTGFDTGHLAGSKEGEKGSDGLPIPSPAYGELRLRGENLSTSHGNRSVSEHRLVLVMRSGKEKVYPCLPAREAARAPYRVLGEASVEEDVAAGNAVDRARHAGRAGHRPGLVEEPPRSSVWCRSRPAGPAPGPAAGDSPSAALRRARKASTAAASPSLPATTWASLGRKTPPSTTPLICRATIDSTTTRER